MPVFPKRTLCFTSLFSLALKTGDQTTAGHWFPVCLLPGDRQSTLGLWTEENISHINSGGLLQRRSRKYIFYWHISIKFTVQTAGAWQELSARYVQGCALSLVKRQRKMFKGHQSALLILSGFRVGRTYINSLSLLIFHYTDMINLKFRTFGNFRKENKTQFTPPEHMSFCSWLEQEAQVLWRSAWPFAT